MSPLLQFLLLVIISYFLGGLPNGKWIADLKGVNILEVGSGNIGAANVNRALGPRFAGIVLALDAAKGFFPTLVAQGAFQTDWMVCGVALAAFLGHIFSPFLRFKGGKGVSTYLGVLLAIAPLPTIVVFLIGIIAVWAVRVTSLVDLVLFLFAVPMLYYFASPHYAAFGIIIWGLLIYTHRSNIERLLSGNELRIFGS
ncbi:MAG: glycerol-3-phosphate 1-O-acyltransferase PlsY [Methanotrichaceae archaeon]